MLPAKPKRLALSLVLYTALALALASFAQANDGVAFAHRRDHGLVHRMIKERSPLPPPQKDPVAIGAVADPPAADETNTATTAAPTLTRQPTVTRPIPTTTASTTSDDSQPTTTVLSVTPVTTATTSSKKATTTAATTTSTSSTTTSTASKTPTVTPTAPTTPVALSPNIVTSTSTAAVQATAEVPHPNNSALKSDRVVTVVLVAVGASIAGIVIIWTIIRKWKFSKSDSFDDRMQPIDWQPTAGSGSDDNGLPIHRRHSAASSFHSGSGHDGNMAGYGAGYGATDNSRLGPPAAAIPDHDFTAGPADRYAAYADVARGPSPQPPMQEAYGRGPAGHGTHDAYGPGAGYRY